MSRRTIQPARAPIVEDSAPASGAAPCPNARHVELVWLDPVTGERLSLALDASPALIENLREDGFEVVVARATGGDGPGSNAAA